MRRIYLNNRVLTKYFSSTTNSRIKCSCGHSVLIPTHDDKAICRWCGNLVFGNEKAEFKYRMKEKIAKEKRNNK